MPVKASALCSRQDVIDYMELSSLTPAQGTLLDLMINGVTSYMQLKLGRKFKLRAASAMGSYNPTGTPDDAIFEYPKGGRIFLPQYPVATIATFYLPYASGGTVDSTTVTRTDYWLDKREGIIELTYADVWRDVLWQDFRALAPGYKTYRAAANYKGGYATIPQDLQLAAMERVAGRWRSRKRDQMLRAEGIQGARFEYLVGDGVQQVSVPAWVAEIENSYKRWKI